MIAGAVGTLIQNVTDGLDIGRGLESCHLNDDLTVRSRSLELERSGNAAKVCEKLNSPIRIDNLKLLTHSQDDCTLS